MTGVEVMTRSDALMGSKCGSWQVAVVLRRSLLGDVGLRLEEAAVEAMRNDEGTMSILRPC